MRIFDKFAQFVLNGRSRAIAMAVLLVFLPISRLFGWAVLGLVTLRKGAIEGGIVLGFLVLALVGIGLGLKTFGPQEAVESSQQMVSLGLVGLVLSSFFVWVLAIVLRQQASWSRVFQTSLWSGIVIIVAAHLMYPELIAFWIPIVKDNLLRMQTQFPEMKLSSADTLSAQAAKVMTGAHILITLLASLLSLLIARWWQASLYNPRGLRQELLQIRFGVLETVLLGVVALFALTDISATGKAIAIDIIPVIGILFVLAGLSLVHRFIAIVKKPWVGVLIFYGLLLVVEFRYMILLLVSLALVDSLINLNARLIKR